MEQVNQGSIPEIAIDPLFAEMYERLKTLASRQRTRSGKPLTLCTTELVHEMYLRMGASNFQYQEVAKFYSYAARAMRFILVDSARRGAQSMRGGDLTRLDLDDPQVDSASLNPEAAIQLDHALASLEREHARAARVVELHYFAGLELSQVAETLRIAKRTVDRDWRYARAYLAEHSEL